VKRDSSQLPASIIASSNTWFEAVSAGGVWANPPATMQTVRKPMAMNFIRQLYPWAGLFPTRLCGCFHIIMTLDETAKAKAAARAHGAHGFVEKTQITRMLMAEIQRVFS